MAHFHSVSINSNWVKRNDHHAHVVDRLSGPPKNPSHSRNYQTYSSAGSQSHTRGSVNVMRTKLCQVSSHAQIEMTRLKSTIEYSRTVCSVFFFFLILILLSQSIVNGSKCQSLDQVSHGLPDHNMVCSPPKGINKAVLVGFSYFEISFANFYPLTQ